MFLPHRLSFPETRHHNDIRIQTHTRGLWWGYWGENSSYFFYSLKSLPTHFQERIARFPLNHIDRYEKRAQKKRKKWENCKEANEWGPSEAISHDCYTRRHTHTHTHIRSKWFSWMRIATFSAHHQRSNSRLPAWLGLWQKEAAATKTRNGKAGSRIHYGHTATFPVCVYTRMLVSGYVHRLWYKRE